MNKKNYYIEFEKVIREIDLENPPSLLLHSCCGPCSTSVLELLSDYFKITLLYYNPNIYPREEYYKRLEEQKKVLEKVNGRFEIKFLEGRYDPAEYFDAVKGVEQLPEGSQRCFNCYELRLKEAAQFAKNLNMDYFATTLSVSPYKNAQIINKLGEKIAQEYGVKHLPNDFKKKDGYKKSVELSKDWNIYRQDYCGCPFSKREAEEREKK
ncbi:epoxyqueuosine reductase QueH [Lagierella massiliensis]|uniref:epoxyqueuosine reductase QueH n=1 Tax=Lagierella massiliensis TaxID=1689303 RepID=UPI0006D7F3F7|nr:epoxyqueuosine reductase QueH [Lagierella massiliensis]